MSAKADIQQIKDTIQADGSMYVKDDVWPYGVSRLLVVGSLSSHMDVDAFASDLYKYLEIVATPLPKKAGLSNLYSFVVYKATPTVQLYDPTADGLADIPITSYLIEDSFGGKAPFVDHKVAFAALGVLESPVSPDEIADLIEAAASWSWMSNDDETPIPFEDTDVLPPNTWVFLRVDFASMGPIPPKGLKRLLEVSNWNYKVINPIGGISGFFERVFSADEYVGETYSHVLFNPGSATGVTADSLQAEAFGGYAGKIYLSAFTTVEIVEGQGTLDLFYSIQGTEEGASEALGDIAALLQKLLKALPVVLWVAVGLGAAWVGWKGYKYVRSERASLGGG